MIFSKGTIERLKLHVFQGRTSADVYKEMTSELVNDLVRSLKEANDTGEQYHRRIFLRSFISSSEAITFRLKEFFAAQIEHLGISITHNEHMILREQRVEIKDNGTLDTRDLILPHVANLKFSLNFLVRKLDLQRKPNFGEQGWEDYRFALEKRNNLTHPKFPNDLIISDEDFGRIINGWIWFHNEVTIIIEEWAKISQSKKEQNFKDNKQAKE